MLVWIKQHQYYYSEAISILLLCNHSNVFTVFFLLPPNHPPTNTNNYNYKTLT